MLINIRDNVHFKLGGVGDWFGIICYWILIAHVLLFGSYSNFFLSLVLIMITHVCWVYMDDLEFNWVVLCFNLPIWSSGRPWSFVSVG